MSIRSSRGNVAGIASLLVLAACTGRTEDGAPSVGRAASAVTARTATVGACLRGSTAGGEDAVVTLPDACAGTGAGRVIATLAAGTPCRSLLGTPMGVVANGVRKSYLFDGAPAELNERYCVLDLAPGDGDVLDVEGAATGLVGDLCGAEGVAEVTRDCSQNALRPSTREPDAYHAPSGSVIVPRAGAIGGNAPSSVDPYGPNGCDVCVTAAGGVLYVTVPASYEATQSGATMRVRIGAMATRDVVVEAPPHAQSFTVSGVAVPPGATLTLFPPAAATLQ